MVYLYSEENYDKKSTLATESKAELLLSFYFEQRVYWHLKSIKKRQSTVFKVHPLQKILEKLSGLASQ